MAVVVEIDGERIEVTETRVGKMIDKLVHRQDRIGAIAFGEIQLHFAKPSQDVKVKVTEVEW